jgi:hypothetical protein
MLWLLITTKKAYILRKRGKTIWGHRKKLDARKGNGITSKTTRDRKSVYGLTSFYPVERKLVYGLASVTFPVGAWPKHTSTCKIKHPGIPRISIIM